jgi:hypothetical protein
MMTESKIFKGIEYIQLNELPEAQRDHLVQTINKGLFIKIMIDGKILNDCLQYRDYSFWYNSVYKAQRTKVDGTPVAPVGFNTELALNS